MVRLTDDSPRIFRAFRTILHSRLRVATRLRLWQMHRWRKEEDTVDFVLRIRDYGRIGRVKECEQMVTGWSIR